MWTSHRIELEKSNVQLFCRADGHPHPTITWLDRNDVTIKNSSKHYEVGVAHIIVAKQVYSSRPTQSSAVLGFTAILFLSFFYLLFRHLPNELTERKSTKPATCSEVSSV